MSRFNCCFSAIVGVGRKKEKGDKSLSTTAAAYNKKKLKNFEVRRLETNESKSISFSVPAPFGISGNSRSKVMDHESPVEDDDLDEDYLPMKRDHNNSDFDLQSHHVFDSNSETNQPIIEKEFSKTQQPYKDPEEGDGLIQKNVNIISDPGVEKVEFWGLPELKRSCSDLETREVLRRISDQLLPPSKSESYEELQQLAELFLEEARPENSGSPPRSVMSHFSADKVMLKKHSSSSQVLPSRSRRLWWKLFLWSHRNLQQLSWNLKPETPSVLINQHGGYHCSDTLDQPNRALKVEEEAVPEENEDKYQQNWTSGFHGGGGGASVFMPQNQWIAFSSTESAPLTRVDEWVKQLTTQPALPLNNDKEETTDDEESAVVINFPPSPENGKKSLATTSCCAASQSIQHLNLNLPPEEILYANTVIRSLNSSSTVAHMTGVGLKVIPTLAKFFTLRSVNLSGNSIVHIASGSLPKGLHTLNLSRNKISSIEGFRELTRLRILDISYNRISRIGQGLSTCTLIKELYLAGNKISEVEGLHRLLKLTVVDLSFNKITTAKGLGQLVANYNSLVALNLLGNPIQSNISDEQLRKAVCSLLPKLAYLNKQPINPHKAREVAKESIAKAALGNSNSRGSHRKTVKRASQGGSVSSILHWGGASTASLGQKTMHKTKGRTSHNSALKMKSAELASSTQYQ